MTSAGVAASIQRTFGASRHADRNAGPAGPLPTMVHVTGTAA
jgi:hypothetical protein